MKPFNVINYNVNSKVFESYDIMPYLIEKYKKSHPTDLKKFVKSESMYMWWARCQYEIILKDWPNQAVEEKWDIYKQILMNLDVIIDVLNENIKEIEVVQ